MMASLTGYVWVFFRLIRIQSKIVLKVLIPPFLLNKMIKLNIVPTNWSPGTYSEEYLCRKQKRDRIGAEYCRLRLRSGCYFLRVYKSLSLTRPWIVSAVWIAVSICWANARCNGRPVWVSLEILSSSIWSKLDYMLKLKTYGKVREAMYGSTWLVVTDGPKEMEHG